MGRLTLFWTDALVYLLVAMVAGFIWYVGSREHLRRPWRQIVGDKVAMVSLLVLMAFSGIGLLDSVHFYPAVEEGKGGNEAISLFDWWATPMRTHDEKTYSRPFAAVSYSREFLVRPDGSQGWEYPRLAHGGAHLRDPDVERGPDIARTVADGFVKGGLLWAVCAAGLCGWLTVRGGRSWWRTLWDVAEDRTETPWRALLATLLLLLSCGWALAELSASYHVLGTDKVGQDVFYQSLKSIRTGLVIGTLTTLVMLPFALVLGILAGFFPGWVDDVIQYLYTTLNSIPSVLLIAAAILMMQVYMANHEADFASLAVRADLRLLFLCGILGVTSWTGLCRLLRAETLKLREMEFVQAARALGVRPWVILARHILPNVLHIVLISVVLDFSALVLAEAVLSYVNIGVDPTTQSWGNMINSARLELAREPVVWWSLAAAFTFMFALVLAANLFADAVRDALDPRRAEV
ncbi:ABC transporter permease [Methylogaea oryzae]|nr:ABC transporter permease [Methylogaea oryzae]